ncbi:MAG: hypothetical protein WDM85_14715 [Caulobacteraceae bacterium]
MRQEAVSASDPSLDSDSRAALDSGFKSNLAQIQQAISGAGVSGVNLLDGSTTGGANVSAATLTGVNLSLGGPIIGVAANASLSDPTAAAAIATSSEPRSTRSATRSIKSPPRASRSKAISTWSPRPVLASPASTAASTPTGARLAALQVQQQLSLSNGAVANQSPNAILALFQAS